MVKVIGIILARSRSKTVLKTELRASKNKKKCKNRLL